MHSMQMSTINCQSGILFLIFVCYLFFYDQNQDLYNRICRVTSPALALVCLQKILILQLNWAKTLLKGTFSRAISFTIHHLYPSIIWKGGQKLTCLCTLTSITFELVLMVVRHLDQTFQIFSFARIFSQSFVLICFNIL